MNYYLTATVGDKNNLTNVNTSMLFAKNEDEAIGMATKQFLDKFSGYTVGAVSAFKQEPEDSLSAYLLTVNLTKESHRLLEGEKGDCTLQWLANGNRGLVVAVIEQEKVSDKLQTLYNKAGTYRNIATVVLNMVKAFFNK